MVVVQRKPKPKQTERKQQGMQAQQRAYVVLDAVATGRKEKIPLKILPILNNILTG